MAQLLRYRVEGSSRKNTHKTHTHTHTGQIIKLFSGSLFFTAFVGTRHTTTTTTTNGGAAVSTRNRNRFQDPSGASNVALTHSDLLLSLHPSLYLSRLDRASCYVPRARWHCLLRLQRAMAARVKGRAAVATVRRVERSFGRQKVPRLRSLSPVAGVLSVIRFALHKVHDLMAVAPPRSTPPAPSAPFPLPVSCSGTTHGGDRWRPLCSCCCLCLTQ